MFAFARALLWAHKFMGPKVRPACIRSQGQSCTLRFTNVATFASRRHTAPTYFAGQCKTMGLTHSQSRTCRHKSGKPLMSASSVAREGTATAKGSEARRDTHQ